MVFCGKNCQKVHLVPTIKLALRRAFQIGANHFRSSKIGRVTKFCVDCHIFKFLATTNLDGDRELAGDRGLDWLVANFYHILYYLLILI